MFSSDLLGRRGGQPRQPIGTPPATAALPHRLHLPPVALRGRSPRPLLLHSVRLSPLTGVRAPMSRRAAGVGFLRGALEQASDERMSGVWSLDHAVAVGESAGGGDSADVVHDGGDGRCGVYPYRRHDGGVCNHVHADGVSDGGRDG